MPLKRSNLLRTRSHADVKMKGVSSLLLSAARVTPVKTFSVCADVCDGEGEGGGIGAAVLDVLMV